MSDKPRKKNIMGQPSSKPNYQIWIIVGLMAFVFGISYFSNSSSAVEISFKRFEQMLLSNDIKDVVLIRNQNKVEVTLKGDALQNSKYKLQLEQQNKFGNANGPHYFFKIESLEIFDRKFIELDSKLNSNNSYDYRVEDRSDYTQIFMNSGFLIFIILGFWLLMRRMTPWCTTWR